MSEEKKIERIVEYLNRAINVERNSYFGKGCITMPLIEADKILDILKGYRKQSEGEWGISKIGDGGTTRTCSNCHISQTVNVYNGKVMFKYCPYCGAKMKGV